MRIAGRIHTQLSADTPSSTSVSASRSSEQRYQRRAERTCRVPWLEDDRKSCARGTSEHELRSARERGSKHRAISAEESLRQGPDIVVGIDDGDAVLSPRFSNWRIAVARDCNACCTRGPSGIGEVRENVERQHRGMNSFSCAAEVLGVVASLDLGEWARKPASAATVGSQKMEQCGGEEGGGGKEGGHGA